MWITVSASPINSCNCLDICWNSNTRYYSYQITYSSHPSPSTSVWYPANIDNKPFSGLHSGEDSLLALCPACVLVSWISGTNGGDTWKFVHFDDALRNKASDVHLCDPWINMSSLKLYLFISYFHFVENNNIGALVFTLYL